MNITETIIEDGRQYWAINKIMRIKNFESLYKETKRRIREDIENILV
jgi:hypothetical protein